MWLSGADHQAFAGGLHGLLCEVLQAIDLKHSFGLAQKSIEEPEVAAGDPEDGSSGLFRLGFSRERYTAWGPVPFENAMHFRSIERMELMYEPDAGVQLRLPSHPLLQARHAYQHNTDPSLIEDGADLFEAVGSEPVGFIDDD